MADGVPWCEVEFFGTLRVPSAPAALKETFSLRSNQRSSIKNDRDINKKQKTHLGQTISGSLRLGHFHLVNKSNLTLGGRTRTGQQPNTD
jgi:hypothetical protein